MVDIRKRVCLKSLDKNKGNPLKKD